MEAKTKCRMAAGLMEGSLWFAGFFLWLLLFCGSSLICCAAGSSEVIYHVHTGSPEEGGGCYTTPAFHTHAGNTSEGGKCYTYEEYWCGNWSRDYYDSDRGNYRYHCKTCGATGYDSGNLTSLSSSHWPVGWHLTCTEDDTAPESYQLGCNKTTTTKIATFFIRPDVDGVTKMVNLNAGVMDESGIPSTVSFQWNNGSTASSIQARENTVYSCKISYTNAGKTYESTLRYTVETLDYASPVMGGYTVYPSACTREPVTVSVSAVDRANLGGTASGLHDKAYSWDNGATWTNNNTKLIRENGIYFVWIRDKLSNTDRHMIEVSNIDKTPPIIEKIIQTPQQWTTGTASLTVTARDPYENGRAGSGLHEKAYSWDGGTTWSSSHTYAVHSAGKYQVKVRDAAGNAVSQTIEVKKHQDGSGNGNENGGNGDGSSNGNGNGGSGDGSSNGNGNGGSGDGSSNGNGDSGNEGSGGNGGGNGNEGSGGNSGGNGNGGSGDGSSNGSGNGGSGGSSGGNSGGNGNGGNGSSGNNGSSHSGSGSGNGNSSGSGNSTGGLIDRIPDILSGIVLTPQAQADADKETDSIVKKNKTSAKDTKKTTAQKESASKGTVFKSSIKTAGKGTGSKNNTLIDTKTSLGWLLANRMNHDGTQKSVAEDITLEDAESIEIEEYFDNNQQEIQELEREEMTRQKAAQKALKILGIALGTILVLAGICYGIYWFCLAVEVWNLNEERKYIRLGKICLFASKEGCFVKLSERLLEKAETIHYQLRFGMILSSWFYNKELLVVTPDEEIDTYIDEEVELQIP